MRHVVMTRSAYGRGWKLGANRRRLAITAGVTVRSLAAQTVKDWTWIVAVSPHDELAAERRAVFEEAGVPVRFIDFDSDLEAPSEAAFAAYRAPWGLDHDDWLMMTRLDDDDAFAPDVFARLRRRPVEGRVALMFPSGFRVQGLGCTAVWHPTNAMHTLVTPPGDDLDVYAYGHRRVAETVRVVIVDRKPAWLWVRHPDTISGWQQVEQVTPPGLKAKFPIDWSVLGKDWDKKRGGRKFR